MQYSAKEASRFYKRDASNSLGDIERNCDVGIVLMDQTARVFHNVKEATKVYKKHVHQTKK